MRTINISEQSFLDALAFRGKAYLELIKLRLSALVTFSAVFGFILGDTGAIFSWGAFFALMIGGFLITGASGAANEILEREYDKLMKRTENRPLPLKQISVSEAYWFTLIIGTLGIAILWIFTNPLTTLLGILSMVLYIFVYTPLKRVGPVAVFVGAIPGAMPPLLGWTAATGNIGVEALIIFGIQFIWQFPHFWAIAWVSDEDYKRAGFKLLPSGGKKDLNTAIQIMIYTLFLIPLGLLPMYFGLTGINSAVVVTICGVLFLAQTFSLMRDCSRKSALKIMFGSFLYLPIVQIAYLLDKI
ncbi:Heme O synthase, protoheme IX farnesyltransferase COX10-CtaB [Indibacter alkaliphilus LW1]|jgi:protoheme IX farnesyltransferase|uniref:Protoheme IX farnesyltransferase n=1 Tax=Indibacter alkaliphilus (strain CCUG 57479 / KCTC 22604 / LW1) TaxID=1189612 RepID=S2DR38_INDAL|nr:heme o synthase [Indibacter alkaliphilus]EOZ92368.1 Heme O synthase, protoheme IX farnesyltransferase COX10-CtaB [Indibacter alkaliphilus LW1]